MRHWGDQIRGLNKFIFQLLNITVNLKTHKSFAEQLYKLEWICRVVRYLIAWDIKQLVLTPSHLLNHREIDLLAQLILFFFPPFKTQCEVILRLLWILFIYYLFASLPLKIEKTKSCQG